jgi:UPF0716 family protein affecting phage T7 exclusion
MKNFFKQLLAAIVRAFEVANEAIDALIGATVKTCETSRAHNKKELHKYLPYVLLAIALVMPGLLTGVIAVLCFYAFSVMLGALALYVIIHIVQDVARMFGWTNQVNA